MVRNQRGVDGNPVNQSDALTGGNDADGGHKPAGKEKIMKTAMVEYNASNGRYYLWLRGNETEEWMFIQSFGAVSQDDFGVGWINEKLMMMIIDLKKSGFAVSFH